MTDLTEQFSAYGRWRGHASDAVARLRAWLARNDVGNAQADLRLQYLLDRLRDDKLTVAFVAEFSRGKSELINAIFFADHGDRILPSSAGRTTMCPTELQWHKGAQPELRLLPIRSRARQTPVSELKRYPEEWTVIALDSVDAPGLQAALARVGETERVEVAEAQALGFRVDEEGGDGIRPDADGRIEIPRWRHAVIQFPHPLLEQGLVVLDTPGLNAIGAEPELTLSMLPNAHAVLFILAADTGVTQSDLAVWRNYVQAGSERQRGRLIVLNKIDLVDDPAAMLATQLGFLTATGEPGSMPNQLVALLVSAVLLSLPVAAINVVMGELVAKSYSAVHPHRTALRLYRFVRFAAIVFAIPSAIAVKIASLVTKRFGATASFAVANQAEEEIREILESYEETGEIEEGERVMLHSVFEFGDTVAREIMTPRVDLDSVPVGTSLADVARIVEETGHSRIPVYEGTDDSILGVIHAKDILSAVSRGNANGTAETLMRTATFVPENKNLHELLHEMRLNKTQLVVVQDEFGGTAGIVTIEDIVEEVVGEIVDEYDNEEPGIVETAQGFLVGGKLHIDDVNAAVGSSLESEEFDTIGGYVFGLFGRQPHAGEEIEASGYRFTVVESDGRRIHTVRVQAMNAVSPGSSRPASSL